ncbi:hypothetical protein HYFRA_00013096 [Hymenoscyphus fraxineus]|uniref:Spherulin 4-like cell surface protein n=1 Tax=Hymenoscyphus fraxineus TaxID=746836 RepID=A0A9N9L6A7_9HELO|nr:hypothetical protein HYFRA_00013096 [Hymenoscyphus fraxineus]
MKGTRYTNRGVFDRTFRGRSPRCKCLTITAVVIAILIIIIVPTAVVVTQRNSLLPILPATVLVPLYIYPISDRTYDPLHNAIQAHPKLNFTVIINPSSGPGSSPLPDSSYTPEIQKLNAFSNVRTVGYVRTGYGSRNISEVLADVNTYSGWASNQSANIAMHGIFFDEAPYLYSQQNAAFLVTINQAVKNSTGIQPDRITIHNPGTIPDARLVDDSTDFTVVFEGSYQEFKEKQESLSTLPQPRSKYSYVVHSIPKLSKHSIHNFVAEVSQHATLFSLTDVNVNFYEKFGSRRIRTIETVIYGLGAVDISILFDNQCTWLNSYSSLNPLVPRTTNLTQSRMVKRVLPYVTEPPDRVVVTCVWRYEGKAPLEPACVDIKLEQLADLYSPAVKLSGCSQLEETVGPILEGAPRRSKVFRRPSRTKHKHLYLMPHSTPPPSAVLIPLYIYPLPHAWTPLYEAISTYPNVTFVVIINPHNGPGASSQPDAAYSRELGKLSVFANVRLVGYVRVNYCERNLAEVHEDINKYAGWSKTAIRSSSPTPSDSAQMSVAVHGIFVDETPNSYTEERAMYLENVTSLVKKTPGILGDRVVIHNPGTVPDIELAESGPDITTVVEESWSSYQSEALQERLSSLLRYDRNQCSFMVHSVPVEEVSPLVQGLRHRGAYLFVTDLREDYYCRFGKSWGDFVKAMAAALATLLKRSKSEIYATNERKSFSGLQLNRI